MPLITKKLYANTKKGGNQPPPKNSGIKWADTHREPEPKAKQDLVSGGGLKRTGSKAGPWKPQKPEAEGPLELQGQKVEATEAKKEEENPDEFFENRVLKPLPEFAFSAEYKDLALSIQWEIINENPDVRFSDIIGLTETKWLTKEAVLFPLKYPMYF